ncbi:glycosyltransferase family 2 protein [Rothia nasimurium]|uniref:glycosyltransferase family 2 protein n=1 Tax=Rothia nasimurium TaxID=85336 RepID=UPI00235192F0|nr:glycosyltransferase family 2 protein [Rothia nasimurium]
MATPRTSIIMPVYNTAHEVVRSIESVMAQTDQDFELIIINDQTPDHADSVIRNYLKQNPDPRVKYLTNEINMGLAATRNRGMKEATGEWLAYLDSDDAYQPDFLATMHAHTSEDIDVVVCAHSVLYPDGESRYRLRGKAGTYTGQQAMLKLLRDETTPYAWDKIFRRTAVHGLEFPIVNRVEDAAYAVAAYQQVRKVRVIDTSLVLYSVNPQSITWGSVPPIPEINRYIDYLKNTTGAHRGTSAEQVALATSWVGAYLNGAQSALRLRPDHLNTYLKDCRAALRWPLILKTAQAQPLFAAAGALLKVSPALYKVLYGAYVKKMYGL